LITQEELTSLLSRATADIEPAPVRVDELISSGRRGRRRRAAYVGSGTVAAVALAGTLAVTTPWSSHHPAPTPIADTGTCLANIPNRQLPAWARAGFSGKHPKLPHVVGKNGELAALLFGQPLRAPAPTDGRTNKILWVANTARIGTDAPAAGTPLVIHARLTDGSASVVRTVTGGPGPSTIDLPVAGCWQLDLTWGSVSDRLNLAYAPD
jgi:hypothetical protein